MNPTPAATPTNNDGIADLFKKCDSNLDQFLSEVAKKTVQRNASRLSAPEPGFKDTLESLSQKLDRIQEQIRALEGQYAEVRTLQMQVRNLEQTLASFCAEKAAEDQKLAELAKSIRSRHLVYDFFIASIVVVLILALSFVLSFAYQQSAQYVPNYSPRHGGGGVWDWERWFD